MLRSEVVVSDPFAARLNRPVFPFVLSEIEFSVAVKGSIREGTRSRGMRMARRLSETSII